MHLSPTSLMPLGHTHVHVSGLKIQPGAHCMSGQTQEHKVLSNILGLGQDIGVQQSHLATPPFTDAGHQKQNELDSLLSGHGRVDTHLSLTVLSEHCGNDIFALICHIHKLVFPSALDIYINNVKKRTLMKHKKSKFFFLLSLTLLVHRTWRSCWHHNSDIHTC